MGRGEALSIEETQPQLHLCRRQERPDLTFQRIMGGLLLMTAIMVPMVLGGDATFSVVAMPLGIAFLAARDDLRQWEEVRK